MPFPAASLTKAAPPTESPWTKRLSVSERAMHADNSHDTPLFAATALTCFPEWEAVVAKVLTVRKGLNNTEQSDNSAPELHL